MSNTSILNPALQPLAALVGKWKVTGTHPMVPGTTFHGQYTFQWIEGGAFMLMQSEMVEPTIPSGTAVGSDDGTEKFYLLYFDERKVSRKYDVKFTKDGLRRERYDPKFSQRFTWKFENDGNTIASSGEMCRDGKTWETDLQLTFTKMT